MGGRTSRAQSNYTQNTDARQLDQSARTFTDQSEGNINAAGPVNIESVEASLEAIRASVDLSRESTSQFETVNETARRQAEEQSRATAEANETARQLAEEQRLATEAAIAATTTVSTSAIEGANRTAETAIRSVSESAGAAINSNVDVIRRGFDATERGIEETLNFLRADDASDSAVIADNFDFLGDTIREANDLSSKSLEGAFNSTVGGFAEQQQKMLIWGLVAVVGLGAVAIWSARQ